ncbi:RNA polymerase-associated protein RapA [Acaryochloris thomasi RCC1774]|uniref:RNA polymerase-associated protein RapA n=1 Tax=Acaryochloris thomasi RCC1774 TaxID=1764569 RepID=A0A2W1JMM3_9CYAN|nr:DEAD/DEAH box helicase [Acaryochloris thomasi]PZD72705.1 RNA polymerase-associated protein RapA [Acaryochloris thomasi RCC1774]
MFDSDLKIDKQRSQLQDLYNACPAVAQEIVQLLAVVYEPVNRTTIMECLNKLGIRDLDQAPFISKNLKPYIDGLLDAGLLLQERGQGPQCHPFIAEIATRDAVKAGRFAVYARVVQKAIPIYYPHQNAPRRFKSEAQFLREARIDFYRQDFASFEAQIKDYHQAKYPQDKLTQAEVIATICSNPFDAEWFQSLSPNFYELGLYGIFDHSVLTLANCEEAFEMLLEESVAENSRCSAALKLMLAEQLLLRGDVEEVPAVLESLAQLSEDSAATYWGWLAFLQGDTSKAIAHYTRALTHLRAVKKKRKAYFGNISGLFFILALLQDGSPERLQEAQSYTQQMVRQPKHYWLRTTYVWLNQFLQLQQGDLSSKASLLGAYIHPYEGHHSLDILFGSLCQYWVNADRAQKKLPRILMPLYQQAMRSGYHWVAMEVASLLAKLEPDATYETQSEILRQGSGIQPLVNIIHTLEPWEMSLKALAKLHQEPVSPVASDFRMAWFITLYGKNWSLQPREQKLSAKGGWSKGRPIAMKRLYKNPSGELEYLSAQDLRICNQIETYSTYGYHSGTEYRFAECAIATLIGHPYVFWEETPTIPIEVVKGEPELLIQKEKAGQLALTLTPNFKSNDEIVVIKETPTRLKVIKIQADHHQIATILGQKNRLTVPERAKEQVLAAINAVSNLVTVQSDIGGGVASATEVPSQATPHVHLLPAGEGLKVAVFSRPFPEGGPYYRPGSGGETVIAEIGDRRLQTTRDLKQERKLSKTAISACPTLLRHEGQESEWLLEEPENCLELLLELQDLGDHIVLEWPEGEKLRVSHRADVGQFQLQIKRQRDWFAASGELQLADDEVLDMQALLKLLEQTPSRFIPLGDGQFVALTQEFRKRLDELRAYSETQGDGLRFHPLTAVALEDMVDDVGQLKADKHWKAHVKKLKDVKKFQPKLPSTLQAELRDYQEEGFEWLARLSHWGVGACLADDMGLGKTLQALAVILTRAPQGPTLVIAPTSVGMNWLSEAQRFAPTLKPLQFGNSDRQQLLDQLQPFDLLVCSYGLLQQEDVAQMLAKVEWQTTVLDEAQAIKNMATKRSQAAMNLQAGFKILTTGTPIENHLGELWNLFRFINPGLLGSLDRFNQRFATPIEKYQDHQARHRLKKLIQPFLLRRTKNQVLEELPSRTEITLQVELSQEEMALYEALRRDAIAKLTESDSEAGAKHLQVLAEIMKLRRACCNPQLVVPKAPPPSAKLQLFSETLAELLANHHKALVFSQFVDHLQILRQYLDKQKIAYQYLDGSTPAKKRQERVNAFQAGEGDVFLISLKAGGTGLNLTAADYVIHMDPWWNPAVEDQASDRAHRIGQQRPVTIYRLVAKGTIEEQIVDLHQHKRDLADSLLEGAEMSGKISTDELLRLIHEG